MSAEKLYRQCRLRRGTTETVGWIEARGAKVGATSGSTYIILAPRTADLDKAIEHTQGAVADA